MYLMMEKQRNRGQDGCGVANVKLDVPPGVKYVNCEKSIDKDPIKDVFERVQTSGKEKLKRAPSDATTPGGADGSSSVDPSWVKENVPFTGELFLAHVRYGTDSDNSIDRCHPVLRESNWMTRSLLLAGNFNITNNEDLFSSLVEIGQHPRELSDTVTLLEKIGHFVDKENNDLYVKYSATGQAPRTCFSLIAENINVARILRRASSDWDGGYCIAGVFGHGDAFVLRDPCGIRPAFFMANDEVIVVASEAPLIQTVFDAKIEQVKPLPPGQALVIKRNGSWKLEGVLEPKPLKQCSFERIYFSRGNGAEVYREREKLGRSLLTPLMKMLDKSGDSLVNTVLSFIPNTAELAFTGLVKEAHAEMGRRREQIIKQMLEGQSAATDADEALRKIQNLIVRTEKVVHKDAKIRTFIQEDSSREHLTMHAYDIHYGTVIPGEDVLVALDDSIVRGNTLKNAILRTLDKLSPTRIIVLSSCPQIRYPDVYGIDMAKMGDLAAFKAAITLLHERKMDHIIREVYHKCQGQLSKPLCAEFVNPIQKIYEPFTAEEISAKIAEQVTPPDCKADVAILFNTVEAVHAAMPEHTGDWYFTGDYPTPGGMKVSSRAFVLWFEGSSARCYGVSSASSTVGTSVLVVGADGTEHALAWKLSQSQDVGCVYVAPGNGGILGHAMQHVEIDGEGCASRGRLAPTIPVDVPLRPPHFQEVKDFCKERNISLAVVTGKELLRQGLADSLRSTGLPVCGPSKEAAAIESTSEFSAKWAAKLGVPMAAKTDDGSVTQMSVVAFSDGKTVSVVPAATQDHRRLLDEDRGDMTSGMGSFAPAPSMDEDQLKEVENKIIRPVFDGLMKEGRPYIGSLQFEFCFGEEFPEAICFRCCPSEPVIQTLLPLMSCDIFQVLTACATGNLRSEDLKIHKGKSVVSVVMAAGGFPGTCATGHAINGLDRAHCVPGIHVFHSGTEDAIKGQSKLAKQASGSLPLQAAYPATSPKSRKVVTCDGRVLTVAAIGHSLHEARERAYVAVRAISFNECVYRHDIAALATLTARSPKNRHPSTIHAEISENCAFTYRSAGVDTSACQAALQSFEPLKKRTQKDALVAGAHIIGDEALITSAHALGTKLKLATSVGMYDGVGIDLVALCVNDIVARGAEPISFQDHFATEKLDGHQAMQIVTDIANGCVEAGCSLVDTGLSELPGVFARDGCDLVGFCVGKVHKTQILPRKDTMLAGDVLLGLPSSGLHSNGFSLIRAIIKAAGLDYNNPAPFDPTRNLGEALLPPSRIYVKAILELQKAGLLKGATQVANGGLERCFDNVLPPHMIGKLKSDSWELPASLRWLAAVGKVPCKELLATFNCGLGMILIVARESKDQAMGILSSMREEPIEVGKLVPRVVEGGSIEVEGAQGAWLMLPELGVSLPFPQVLSSLQDPYTVSRMRTMVLVGSEDITPLQALINATALPVSAAATVSVASCDPKAKALQLATSANIPTCVIGDGRFAAGMDLVLKGYGCDDAVKAVNQGEAGSSAAEFCAELQKQMDASQVELLVILDDFDTDFLTRAFLQSHVGKAIYVHASLLPAFAGKTPLSDALRVGVCVTGCTVGFTVPPSGFSGGEGRCHGPQIMQETAGISVCDTIGSLRQRIISECEVPAVCKAVQLVASGSVALRQDECGYGLGRSASFSEAASADLLWKPQP